MMATICLKTESDLTMTILAGDRQLSILLDGQAQNLGLPFLRECISRSYGQSRWLYELPGIAAIQTPTNGQRGLGPSRSLKIIAVSGLVLVGRDPCAPLPQFKRGQQELATHHTQRTHHTHRFASECNQYHEPH